MVQWFPFKIELHRVIIIIIIAVIIIIVSVTYSISALGTEW